MGRFSFLAACMALLLVPTAAVAGEGLSRPVEGQTILRFGAPYSSGAKQVTHRGLDLIAETGEAVLAPAGGTVTFSGEIPADGGGRCLAVTVTTPGGLMVCVSPLTSASVRKGMQVSAGDRLGDLAGSGDGSSAKPHVHLSVRLEGAYIDPEPLLEDECAAAAAIPSGADAGQSATSGQPVPGAQASAVTANSGSSALPASTAIAGASQGSQIRGLEADLARNADLAETVNAAFALEIGRLRHTSIRHAPSLAEQGAADVLRAALSGDAPVLPVSGVGIGLAAALAGCVAILDKARYADSLSVFSREC